MVSSPVYNRIVILHNDRNIIINSSNARKNASEDDVRVNYFHRCKGRDPQLTARGSTSRFNRSAKKFQRYVHIHMHMLLRLGLCSSVAAPDFRNIKTFLNEDISLLYDLQK